MTFPRVGGGKQYPLSFQQQTTYLVELTSPDALSSPHYIIYLVLRLKGPLRYEVLQAAFNDVVDRQSALRTRLAVTPEEDIVQEEFSGVRAPLEVTEEAGGEAGLPALIERLAGTRIPLDGLPLARLSVHRLGPDDHVLFLGLHHLVSDATSLYVAVEDLARAYEARLEGSRLPVLPWSYGEYALWQAKTYEGRLSRDATFWQEYLEGLAPYEVRQDLPFQPGTPGIQGHDVRLCLLEAEEFESFERFATRHRASTFVALLAGFHVALGSRTASEDRLSITYFDQRDHPSAREMVGSFLSPAPIRTPLARDMPLSKAFPAMSRNVIAAYQRAYMPAQHYLSAYPPGLPSLTGQSAPWIFLHQYQPRSEPHAYRLGEARGPILRAGANTRQEPGMSLRVRRASGGELRLRIGYDPSQWRDASMQALGERYTRVLRAMREDPSRTPAQFLELIGPW